MAYVEIVLISQGVEYIVEVDTSSTPDKLCKQLTEEFSLDGNYGLIPRSNFCLVKDSTWELIEIAPSKTIKSIRKR